MRKKIRLKMLVKDMHKQNNFRSLIKTVKLNLSWEIVIVKKKNVIYVVIEIMLNCNRIV